MKYYGWGNPQDSLKDIRKISRALFDINSAMDSRFKEFKLEGSTTNKRLMHYEIVRKVIGKDTENYAQPIGSCVGYGCKNALEYLQCTEIYLKHDFEQFKPIYLPYVWGACRKAAGYRGKGEGSYGAAAAKGVMNYGSIPLDTPNVPVRNKAVEIDWSGPDRDGTWDFEKFSDIGKKHLVRSTAKLTREEDICDALLNGYPCTIASSQGFEENRNGIVTARADGFNYPRGSWPHQMCHLPQTLIKSRVTSNIEDVKVGDEVYGHDGKLHRVTDVYARPYKGNILQIKVYGCEPIQVTPNHPILISREVEGIESFCQEDVKLLTITKPNTKRVLKWVNAEEVVSGDYLVCPGFLDEYDVEIPNWVESKAKNIPNKLEVSDDLAWLFGLFIADGCASKGHRIQFVLGTHETDIIDKCVKIINEKLGLKTYIKQFDKYVRINAYSSIVANSFCAWFGKGRQKHIPKWLLTWNTIAILEGIFNGDGNLVRNKTKRIVNTSRILIDQLHTILVRHGEKPNIRKTNAKKYSNRNNGDIYCIEWTPNGNTKFNKWDQNNYLCKVKTIDKIDYEGNVYNLEVANVHSYIANGVVTHNCAIGIDLEYKEPYVIILNSWGVSSHSPHKDFQTGEDLPGGVLRVKLNVFVKMAQDECFAYSQYDGFKAQNLTRRHFDI